MRYGRTILPATSRTAPFNFVYVHPSVRPFYVHPSVCSPFYVHQSVGPPFYVHPSVCSLDQPSVSSPSSPSTLPGLLTCLVVIQRALQKSSVLADLLLVFFRANAQTSQLGPAGGRTDGRASGPGAGPPVARPTDRPTDRPGNQPAWDVINCVCLKSALNSVAITLMRTILRAAHSDCVSSQFRCVCLCGRMCVYMYECMCTCACVSVG